LENASGLEKLLAMQQLQQWQEQQRLKQQLEHQQQQEVLLRQLYGALQASALVSDSVAENHVLWPPTCLLRCLFCFYQVHYLFHSLVFQM
jgi:hypothetical protein